MRSGLRSLAPLLAAALASGCAPDPTCQDLHTCEVPPKDAGEGGTDRFESDAQNSGQPEAMPDGGTNEHLDADASATSPQADADATASDADSSAAQGTDAGAQPADARDAFSTGLDGSGCDAAVGSGDGGCGKIPFCGDGVVDPGELCDKGSGNNVGGYNGCNANCTLGPHCGDGVTTGLEVCDQGAANGTFIGECRPDCSGAVDITEFGLNFVDSGPYGIVGGPDGNLWFTESTGGRIGQMSTNGNLLKELYPSGVANPLGIVIGPDGKVWFTESSASRIGYFAVGASAVSDFSLPGADDRGSAITTGPDGALWFIMPTGARIGRVTTSLSFTAYDGCSPMGRCDLYGITSAGGKIWFTDGRTNIRSINANGSALTDYVPTTLPAGPYGITQGPDGNLWFTQATSNKIGTLSIGGAFGPEYAVTPASSPRWIVSGPDGNLWFTEYLGNQIGRVTTAGKVKEAPVPTVDAGVVGIAVGPDGNIWFVENRGNKIARINLKKP